MHPTSRPTPWLLLEAPMTIEPLRELVPHLRETCHGIMLRMGEGLSPFHLAETIRQSGLATGLFLHLRDMNRIALASCLRTAAAAGMELVFIGDPPPRPDTAPVGPVNGPEFAAFARTLLGPATRLGTCNRFSHPLDITLLEKYRQAGIQIAAVGPAAPADLALPPLELWNWRGLSDPAAAVQRPTLIEVAESHHWEPQAIARALAAPVRDHSQGR